MTTEVKTYKRTRIAPTPSGYLHVGNVLSFIITASLAQKHGAKVLLRIDDLDQQRVNQEYVQDIFDTLNFLEIPWHEGPRNYEEYKNEWSQLYRMDGYSSLLQQLKEAGKVFACTCSRTQIRQGINDDAYPGNCIDKHIALDTPNTALRLLTEPEQTLAVNVYSNKLLQVPLPSGVQNFVVRKKDGFPAYQLASVADDLHFGVDLIVRGEDLWSSTLAQLYLATQLNQTAFTNATFYHHPLILGEAGLKLSKSAGDTSVQAMRKQGKTPAEVFTGIAYLLGFSTEVNNWTELAKLIDL